MTSRGNRRENINLTPGHNKLSSAGKGCCRLMLLKAAFPKPSIA